MTTEPRFPLCAAEHPNFDQSTLPADMPAGFDDSTWCNDTCPSFINEAAGLVIFIDYANPEDREFPETPRFSLGIWDDGSTGENIIATDDWSEFQRVLAGRLSA